MECRPSRAPSERQAHCKAKYGEDITDAFSLYLGESADGRASEVGLGYAGGAEGTNAVAYLPSSCYFYEDSRVPSSIGVHIKLITVSTLPPHSRLQPVMTEIHTDPLPPIPDDLTIPQFFLDYQHPLRPVRKDLTPWLIEDATGRKIGYEEVCVEVLLNSVPFASADAATLDTRPHLRLG